MSALNWGMISDGSTFESLVCSILSAEDSTVLPFCHPGQDSGQDARSEDGSHVFQMKFRTVNTMPRVIQLVRGELERIRRYRDPSHPNFKHWESVTRWTLIINCTINPNDDSSWKEQVVPAFAEIGIVADYWSLETLESKIIEHPEIRDVFFNGNNRTLLNPSEAFDHLSRTSPGPSFLDRPLLGRKENLEDFSLFLEAEDKPLLAVTGPHGVGKSRFLYEALLAAKDKGWCVFWGLAASMEASNDWFWFRNSSKPTCMFVDEVNSQDLVRRIFEQTTASERMNWKFVISIQPEHEEILTQTGFESLSLKPLSEQESTTLSDNCLPSTHPLIKNGQAHHLYSLTQGLPAWQCLLLEECQNKRRFSLPINFPAFVGKLVQSALKSIPDGIRGYARTMLRWFAAWGVVRIENADSKEFQFLVGKHIPSDCMDEVLSKLIKCRLISEWGINGRSHAVEPAIVRQQILSDWLLKPAEDGHQYKNTRSGQSFVQDLIHFKIPNTPVVLQNLSRMSVSYLPDMDAKLFLRPIFDELESVANGGSLKEQYDVLDLVQRIGYTDPDASLDILKTLRKSKLPDETISHGLFGKTTLSHNSLLSSVCEYLFTVAKDATNRASAHRFIAEIKEYLDFEKQKAVHFIRGQEPSNRLQRLVGHPQCAHLYTPLTTDELRENWDLLSGSLFLQTILKTVWDPYRETVTWFDRSAWFQRYHIVHPDNRVWNLCIEFRKKAFTTLRDSKTDTSLRREVWRQLRHSVSQIDYTNSLYGHDRQASELMVERVREDLETIHEIIDQTQSFLGLEELAEARSVWAPFLIDYKPTILSSLARQCEDQFQRIVHWPVQAMFSSDTWSDETPIDQIVFRLKRENNKSTWKSFFTVAEQYLSAFDPDDHNTHIVHIYKLVEKYCESEKLTKRSPIMRFAVDILRLSSPTALKKEFVVALGRCLVLQTKTKRTSFSAERCLAPFLNGCTWQTELLYAIYRFPHPKTVGQLTTSEFEFLADPVWCFLPRQRSSVLASFFATVPKETEKLLSAILGKSALFSEEQNQRMWSIVESIYMAGLRYDWSKEQIPVDWVMDKIAKLKLDASFLESAPLRWMHDETGWKFTMERFVQFIQSRMELEFGEKPSDRFSVWPYGFPVDKWCEIGPGEKEQKAFDSFCQIAAQKGGYIATIECPEMLPKIDPEGDHIVKFAEWFFSDHPDLDNAELFRLAGLVAHYDEESRGWQAVAKEICKRAKSASMKERNRIFQGFLPRRTFTDRPIGTVPKEVEDNVEDTRIRYEKEPPESPMKEYFEWAWHHAQVELEFAQKLADEEHHGDL